MFSPSRDLLVINDACDGCGASKTHTSAAIDPADLWDAEFSSGTLVTGGCHERYASSSANSDGIDMQTWASGSCNANGHADDDIVSLAGRDGSVFTCSQSDIYHQSAFLYDKITVQPDESKRIDLPHPSNEIKILAETMNTRHLRNDNVWATSSLHEMVRAIELYIHYDFYEWDFCGLELAMLDRLEEGDSDSFARSRFDSPDNFAERLRALAEEQGISRLLHKIERAVPTQVLTYGDGDVERPRKRRKIRHR